MNIWVKRYLIITICFGLAFFPTILVMGQFGIFSNPDTSLIAWIVIGSLAIVYYVVMTILMLRKKGDK